MRSSRTVRILGILQIITGLFLAVFIGIIAFNLAPQLLRPNERTSSGSSFTGTPQQATLILGLFGLIITFGLGSVLSGLYQIATGRRNRWIIFIVLGLAVILYVVANAVHQSLA